MHLDVIQKRTYFCYVSPADAVSDYSFIPPSVEDNIVLQELVYKGVPHSLRCLAWQHLCGAENSPYKEKYSVYLKQVSIQSYAVCNAELALVGLPICLHRW